MEPILDSLVIFRLVCRWSKGTTRSYHCLFQEVQKPQDARVLCVSTVMHHFPPIMVFNINKVHFHYTPFSCQLCGKRLNLKGHYKGHMNSRNNLSLSAGIAPYKFTYKARLRWLSWQAWETTCIVLRKDIRHLWNDAWFKQSFLIKFGDTLIKIINYISFKLIAHNKTACIQYSNSHYYY